MKYFGIIVGLLLLQAAYAQTITVGNVKVSVRAESAASAQEQALDKAHQLAFQKLVHENFPESSVSLPDSDTLREMVRDFSIDREKTTPTSYMASLTFQFSEPSVLAWLQRAQQSDPSLSLVRKPHTENLSLNLTASYTNHTEWQYIKETLENFPGVQTLSIFTLSSKNATMKMTYRGPMDTLKKGLLQKDILLTEQGDGWMVASSR